MLVSATTVLLGMALTALAQEAEVREVAIVPGAPPPRVEVVAQSEGRLHLWAESDDLDPVLRVLAAGGQLRAEDKQGHGGGGTTAYVSLGASAGESWTVEVAPSLEGAEGTARLTIAWSLESDATRDAASWGRSGLDEIRRLATETSSEVARAELDSLVVELLALPGRDRSALLAGLLEDLASLAEDLGDLAGARVARKAVLEHTQRTYPPAHGRLLDARARLATALEALGEGDAGLALRELNVEVAQQHMGEDDENLHWTRRALALAYKERGELEQALTMEQRALAGLERLLASNDPRLLTAQQDLAGTLARMGRPEDAYPIERRVLDALVGSVSVDERRLANARYNHAVTLLELGRLDESRDLLEQVLETYARTLPEEAPPRVSALELLAVLHGEQLDFPACRQLHERVLAIRERMLPPGHPAILMARGNVAYARKAMGDLEGARALEEDALAGLEGLLGEDDPRLAQARSNLAITLRRMGAAERALELQEQALATITRRLPADHVIVVRIRLSLAASLQAMGRPAQARAILEELLADLHAAATPDRIRIAMARANLSSALSRMGEHERAREESAAALETLESIQTPSDLIVLDSRMQLIIDLEACDEPERARKEAGVQAQAMLEALLGAATRSPREARQAAAFAGARFATLIRTGWIDDETIFELAETRRWVSSGMLGSVAAAEDPRTTELRAELFGLRRSLQQLLSGGSALATGDSTAELTRLALQRDRADEALRQHLIDRGARIAPVRAADVARALQPGTVAVGYLSLPDTRREGFEKPEDSSDRIAALVLRPDGSLVRVDLGTAGAIAAAIDAWRTALGSSIQRGQPVAESGAGEREPGAALRALVLDPVLAALPADARPTRLHVALDSMLHLIALDALPLEGEGGDLRVGDRYEIVVETAFDRLASGTRAATAEPFLLSVGGPDFSASPHARPADSPSGQGATSLAGLRPSFTPLLQARLEVETVAALFEQSLEGESVLLTRAEATKERFLELAPRARWLHVATHGWFAPESVSSLTDAPSDDAGGSTLQERVSGLAPMALCGLAFSGANLGRDELGRVPGILLAEELAAVDLSRCELAVLSACETNVGLRRAGEGIQSLQSSLHAAGVRSAITSLWKVDDAATRRLMELFYNYLWVEELPRSQALWKAKLVLRSEGASLRDWSGWVLTGDPD